MSVREEIDQLAVAHGWECEGIGEPITSTRRFIYTKNGRFIDVDWTSTGRLSSWQSHTPLADRGYGWGPGGRHSLIALIVQSPREESRERVAAWVHEHVTRGRGDEQLGVSYERAPLLLSDIKALLEES